MKIVLSALALAACAAGAQAQVTFVDGTERPVFTNYNPNGAAGTLGPVVGGREDAMINTTGRAEPAPAAGLSCRDFASEEICNDLQHSGNVEWLLQVSVIVVEPLPNLPLGM